MSRYHQFAHHAMATHFEVFFDGTDASYAAQAARTCFDELDRYESELSRFRDGTDVWALNALPPGVPMVLGLSTYECLRAAQEIHRDTGGAFDITVGPLMACLRGRDGTPREPDEQAWAQALARTGMDGLALDPDTHTAIKLREGLQVDLGGIGKGYALDQLATMMREDWEIERMLLNGGGSTLLALDAPEGEAGWSVGAGDDQLLAGCALSASGFSVKGAHIIDARRGALLETRRERVWARAESATLSDALSTAFAVMSEPEIATYCRDHEGTGARLLAAGTLRGFGALA